MFPECAAEGLSFGGPWLPPREQVVERIAKESLRVLVEDVLVRIDPATVAKPSPGIEDDRKRRVLGAECVGELRIAVKRDRGKAALGGRPCVAVLARRYFRVDNEDLHALRTVNADELADPLLVDAEAWAVIGIEDDDGELCPPEIVGKCGPHACRVHEREPNLWLLRDKIFGQDDKEVHLFWQAARFESELLPPAVTADPKDPAFFHSVTKTFPLPLPAPDRVTMRVRMRQLDFDLLDELVATQDLDPQVLDRVPTYDLGGATREWTSAGGFRCIE